MSLTSLAITHSDFSCQSGIQKSLATFQENQHFHFTVITSVFNAEPLSDKAKLLQKLDSSIILEQLETVFSYGKIDRTIIGTIIGTDCLFDLASFIERKKLTSIFLNPYFSYSDPDFFHEWINLLLPLANGVFINEEDIETDKLSQLKKRLNDSQWLLLAKNSNRYTLYSNKLTKEFIIEINHNELVNKITATTSFESSIYDILDIF